MEGDDHLCICFMPHAVVQRSRVLWLRETVGVRSCCIMVHHETALEATYKDPLSECEIEDGEIEEDEHHALECQPMDVDLDLVQPVSAEEGEVVEGDLAQAEDVVQPRRHKKSKKKRSGKRSNKNVNLSQFVRETCTRLREKKYPLVWAAVKKLGVDVVQNLVKEVEVIEKCGGQMTNDGKRRRMPGGVMWNILRGRVHPDVYKEIMLQGNEVQKQKAKAAKESLKRSRMDVDEPMSNKRRKMAVKEEDMSTHGKRGSELRQRLRPANKLLDVIDGPQRDDSLLPVIQLQRAWVEGIRKKEHIDEAGTLPGILAGADSGLSGMETVSTLDSNKKSVPLSARLRMPVEYGDLVKEKTSALFSEMPSQH